MLFDELYKMDIFKLTDKDYVRLLFKESMSVQLKNGEFIFHQGMIGRGMYFIVKGGVDVVLELNKNSSKSSKEKQEVILKTFEPYSFLGELCMLEERDRTASAKANQPSELIYLDNRVLNQGFKEGNLNAFQIGVNLGRIMTKHIQALNGYLIEIHERNPIMSMS